MSSSSVLDPSHVVPVASSMDAISDDLAGIAGLSKKHNKNANGVNSFRNDLAGNAGNDSHRLSSRCQCLRFILIDEISMVSAQLIGQLEILVDKVVRKRNRYKHRPDATSRPFGGINVIFFGDCWQSKPVTGTGLFSDIALSPDARAHHALRMFWGRAAGVRAGLLWMLRVS